MKTLIAIGLSAGLLSIYGSAQAQSSSTDPRNTPGSPSYRGAPPQESEADKLAAAKHRHDTNGRETASAGSSWDAVPAAYTTDVQQEAYRAGIAKAAEDDKAGERHSLSAKRTSEYMQLHRTDEQKVRQPFSNGYRNGWTHTHPGH